MREFFHERGYIEVFTPIVVPMPGTEPHLDYFATDWRTPFGRTHSRWLRSSPEIHLKKILADNPQAKIFELGPCFRNGLGEHSAWHNPEFMMLEWYESNLTLEGLMDQTCALIAFCAEKMHKKGYQIVLPPSHWQQITVVEAFKRFAGIVSLDHGDFCRHALAMQVRDGCGSVTENDDFETAFFKVLIEKVEPQLRTIPGAFLTHYPLSMGALAAIDPLQNTALRAEGYLFGHELCNGFVELRGRDANEKRILMSEEIRLKEKRQLTERDSAFFEAMDKLPPCAGNALGFDRLLALLLGAPGIDEIIPFREALTRMPESP